MQMVNSSSLYSLSSLFLSISLLSLSISLSALSLVRANPFFLSSFHGFNMNIGVYFLWWKKVSIHVYTECCTAWSFLLYTTGKYVIINIRRLFSLSLSLSLSQQLKCMNVVLRRRQNIYPKCFKTSMAGTSCCISVLMPILSACLYICRET